MKSYFSILFLCVVCAFMGCSDNEEEMQELLDTEGPEFRRVEWIDSPFISNDPAGAIEDGGNYTISLEGGFHLLVDVRDANNIVEGEMYFTVNNDSEIKEVIFSPSLTIDLNQSGVGYVYRVNKVWLGPDQWYEIQPGDTYQFYARFTDEFDNESSISWTADVVD